MTKEETEDGIDWLSGELLGELAGPRAFERGKDYFDAGAVRSLRRREDAVEAVVQGTRRYRVRLGRDHGDLVYDCNCPIGHNGEFCKHCVAVGLALQAGAQGDRASGAADGGEAPVEVDLRAYLRGLDKEALVSLLVDHADMDERLDRRLTLQAARAAPGSAEPQLWKDTLGEALASDDYGRYGEAYDYATGVEEVIESLDGMLRAGQAETVVRLAEHGLAEVEECVQYLDDSDGWLVGLLDRLQDLHLEACVQARPDPVALAERLFEAEMEATFDVFRGAVEVYADVLGEAGLAAYRRLAEAEWARVPALKPGDGDSDRYGWRYRIKTVMEALARTEGGVDALVAVKSRDLSLPYGFLEIARLYRDAGQPDLALDWAERGWRAFADKRPDERLRSFLAECYQDRGRIDEAMTLVWEAFVGRPDLDSYRRLESHGRRAGEWPAWRDKALAAIRERPVEKSRAPTDGWTLVSDRSQDSSLLVEIFLHEGDPDAAWREAEAGGCSQILWLELAKRREKTHPEDAVGVYQKHIARLLRNTGNSIYAEAVRFLHRIEAILVRAGRQAAFRDLVGEMRLQHKRKRNLMKMLDGKGW